MEGHHTGGPFNRAAAVNLAATNAGAWDVAIIADSDMFCDPARVRQAADLAASEHSLVMPFSVRRDLNPAGTQRVLAGQPQPWAVARSYPETVSGIVAISRTLWDEVGGFDEWFTGWGCEDVAFAAACQTFGGQPVLRIEGDAWHLHHTTAKIGRLRTPAYRAAKERARRYRELIGDVEGTRRLQQEGRRP